MPTVWYYLVTLEDWTEKVCEVISPKTNDDQVIMARFSYLWITDIRFISNWCLSIDNTEH